MNKTKHKPSECPYRKKEGTFGCTECMPKTKESWEEDTLKQEFIRNFCNDHQRIRWLRGAFYDEEEKLNTILEYFDKYEDALQQQESKYLKVLREIVGRELRSSSHLIVQSKRSGYNQKRQEILQIIKNNNIELRGITFDEYTLE